MPEYRVRIDSKKCKGCQLCIAACPKGLLSVKQSLNAKGVAAVHVKGSGCSGCALCAQICPECCIIVESLKA